MARIDLAKPYEDFLKEQVNKGLFRSVTSAVEDAIRKQMEEQEKMRIASVYAAIVEGEADISNGKTHEFSIELMKEISEKAKRKAIEMRN
ncbi:type II toxin-antitoxin system ParD family antitoxin [Jiulongibacter sediminis]|jgi:Arc/MetJ-type ribon-helix-helix transcriptional regulator|uniref:ribbon-helix-helix domain-containing protein n=1 Tax=Jiulongibacter sediminis TaxID=1605367 RepID=UPI0026F22429|nr:hypothetical protein [Jiulongibacter sediminis]